MYLSSGLLFGGWLAVCPGGFFVVGGLVVEAAVEDTGEAVTDGAEGLVVAVSFWCGVGRRRLGLLDCC